MNNTGKNIKAVMAVIMIFLAISVFAGIVMVLGFGAAGFSRSTGDSLNGSSATELSESVMKQTGFVNYVPVGSYTPSGEIPQAGDMAHDAYGGFAWGDFLRRWKYSIHVVNGIQDKV